MREDEPSGQYRSVGSSPVIAHVSAVEDVDRDGQYHPG